MARSCQWAVYIHESRFMAVTLSFPSEFYQGNESDFVVRFSFSTTAKCPILPVALLTHFGDTMYVHLAIVLEFKIQTRRIVHLLNHNHTSH